MNEQTNTKLIQDAYAAFGRGDIPAILAMTTDDVDWQSYGPEELPMCGHRRGKGDVAKFFEQVGKAWNFERFEPRQYVASGDVVVALGAYSGTAKSNGRRFGGEWAHVFTVKNSKITRWREYTDTANLLAAFAPSAVRA